ncbi:MAG: ATP-binding protein [Bacteroidetes bacterium RIFCSPHIGHO2_02_FULL_44_7]|nr:MAG: ATP-binding protein [Bacteroidetes bacterium RIFCSPHIGHO2_02_FULL_44_7]
MTDAQIPLFLNWSSGKDSSLALYYLLKDNRYEVRCLLTSMNSAHDRVSMHGLRRRLLEAQLKALNLPSKTIELPEVTDMETYGKKMKEAVRALRSEGLHYAAFGDIFLEDLRIYREQQLATEGIQALFPLWQRPTRELLEEFIDLGFKAVVICIDNSVLDERFLGRTLDRSFLNDLPTGVDPCGENGEYHTFCYDGPIFQEPIRFVQGERVYRSYPDPSGVEGQEKGFWFLDLLPA